MTLIARNLGSLKLLEGKLGIFCKFQPGDSFGSDSLWGVYGLFKSNVNIPAGMGHKECN